MIQNSKELAEALFPNLSITTEEIEAKYPRRNTSVVTRFAPSPTGFLHIGGVFTALLGEKIAHQSGGIFYYRTEDTDAKRELE